MSDPIERGPGRSRPDDGLDELSRKAVVPLTEAVLCLDCEVFYRREIECCPSCGSRSAFLATRSIQPLLV